jgi:hypothetical protein
MRKNFVVPEAETEARAAADVFQEPVPITCTDGVGTCSLTL